MMKRLLGALALVLFASAAQAQATSAIVVTTCGTPPATYVAGQPYPLTVDTTGKLCDGASGGASAPSAVTTYSSAAITNPTSTLTSGTATAITATNNEISSSTTVGSIVIPSFAIATSAGGAIIPKLTMQTSATSGWGGASIQVDLWRAAPTLTNGDGAVYLPATGSANYIGSYTCTLAQAGDGAYGECTPNAGQADFPKLASGTSVFWTAFSLSTVTKVSGQTFVLTAAVLN